MRCFIDSAFVGENSEILHTHDIMYFIIQEVGAVLFHIMVGVL